MTELKQIIGRGTRLREDYGKTWFNIIGYTGSATVRFADTDFDGCPEAIDVTAIDDQRNEEETESLDPTEPTRTPPDDNSDYDNGSRSDEDNDDDRGAVAEPRKFYLDEGRVAIIGYVVYELDENGKQLRVIQYTDYTAEHVRTLFRTADELRDHSRTTETGET